MAKQSTALTKRNTSLPIAIADRNAPIAVFSGKSDDNDRSGISFFEWALFFFTYRDYSANLSAFSIAVAIWYFVALYNFPMAFFFSVLAIGVLDVAAFVSSEKYRGTRVSILHHANRVIFFFFGGVVLAIVPYLPAYIQYTLGLL